jgi:glycosyltransferase involved in cell wall biosynthesis
MKISIITVCRNAENTILRCMQSVRYQDFLDIEHIIVDGKSSDRTLELIRSGEYTPDILISETDGGIYHAMNKGLKLATGDVVAFLNSDDVYRDPSVVSRMVEPFFGNANLDATFANVEYVDPHRDNRLVRTWISSEHSPGCFARAWMPPHPTFFCRRDAYNLFGGYRTDIGTTADFELLFRFIEQNGLRTIYVNIMAVRMDIGGVSNRSIANVVRQNLAIFRILSEYQYSYSRITFLLFKICRKLAERYTAFLESK